MRVMAEDSDTDPQRRFRERVEKAVARGERDGLTRHEIGTVLEDLAVRELSYEYVGTTEER